MSYDRSPRAVCSTTIGTKFKALVSNSMLLGLPRLRAHEVLEADVLRRAARARQQEVDDLILEHRSLDLRHHVAIASIELRGLVGFFVRRRQLLDSLLDTGLIQFDLVLSQKFLDQKPDRHAPLRGAFEAFARGLLRIGAAHLAQGAFLQRVDFLLDESAW